jgi:uncharacterized damage-inducible protein DinB
VVEVATHMVHWQSWFLKRCADNGIAPVAKASLRWPTADAAEREPVRQRFLEGLDEALELASDQAGCARRIDPPIDFSPLANYTVAGAITHIDIHNAHHLGQVITLRQFLGAWPPPEGSYTWSAQRGPPMAEHV